MAKIEARSTYAKQSGVRVRSSSRLVLLLVTLSIPCYLIWGYGWYVKLLLGAGACFALVTAIEFANVHYHEQRAEKRKSRASQSFAENNEFEYVSTADGNWYERRAVVDGHPIIVRIAPRAMEQAKPLAEALLADPAELARKFRDFKAFEANRNPEFAEEIRDLEIDHMDYGPDIAEVSFTPDSGGDPWTAVYDKGVFRDLQLEN